VLRLTEHAPYGPIGGACGAQASAILARLHDGTPSLTAVGLLAPHLTDENHVQVLDAARHKTKRQVEQLVAMPEPGAHASYGCCSSVALMSWIPCSMNPAMVEAAA
jgi:hypothetical protein